MNILSKKFQCPVAVWSGLNVLSVSSILLATDADALVVVTEWKEFRLPAWATLQRVMRGCVIADGRNIYNGEKLRQMGFTYYKIG